MSKKIQVKKYGDNYFYKAFEAVPEEILEELNLSAIELLSKFRKRLSVEVYPPESTVNILSIVSNISVWNIFFNEIKKHLAKYCEVANIELTNHEVLSLHSSWITRVDDIEIPGEHTKEELRRRLKNNNTFSNMHSLPNSIGLIYYLKNPDPKYGTIVKLEENKLFQNDGEENSLLIFNPQLYHTDLYPPLKELEKSPRIAISLDCEIKIQPLI